MIEQPTASNTGPAKSYCLAFPSGQRIPLTDDILLIGRMPLDPSKHTWIGDLHRENPRIEDGCLYLPDPCVSRQHAVLTRTGDGGYAIEDARSRGGTFVNDQVLREKRTLEIGDTIRLGQSKILYCEESGRDFDPPWFILGSD